MVNSSGQKKETISFEEKGSTGRYSEVRQHILAVLRLINMSEIAQKENEKSVFDHPFTPIAQMHKNQKGRVELTPVNAVFGQKIGRALDGKKTTIGALSALATVVLPAIVPFVPALAPIAAIVENLAPVVLPFASALAGWGVLGKAEKWSQFSSYR